ncbi:Ribosomal RNA small subunit methyltransferase B protein [Salinisphaera shabanensis E1L3A]|uniref:16S rRNA (cytosine(967)-C(5))-methyltransferase n=2 Tax=Salinisphaera shabanensis TaxID=180542 RepID=U2FTH8_9GAMM|nr:Ribosomal RNA small subunit methyltransferase B protein [Salinisphaera shabanensis E1L3A]
MNDRRSLDAALAELPADMSGADRALVSALAYGVLRDYRRLEALLAPKLSRKPQPLLRALLLVGLLQLEAMRIPPHAAVHATVSAAAMLKLGRARGMVNAILRGHQRDAAAADSSELAVGVRYGYPDWVVRMIEADWGSLWPAVLAAGNRPAPMHLRANARQCSRHTAMQRLAEAGIASQAVRVCDSALTLDSAISARDLPGFASGEISIQDAGAQLAAGLVAAQAGDHVLDACAAPGNKSAHLLERADIDLLALDIDATRLETLNETLQRVGTTARVQVADAGDIEHWWDGRAFDRILLDAPCSGTGVIRRHPDIKWLRRPDDIAAAAKRQNALLDGLWRTLAPGGRLVYATCSILRAEGVDVIDAFLARTDDAREQVIDAHWGFAERYGRRIAPGMHGFDGFYYAVLERDAA